MKQKVNVLDNYNVPVYEEERSGNSWITSIFQKSILKLKLTSTDIATVLASIKLPHTYQQSYHAFSQRLIHHRWELAVLNYQKVMAIYPYPLLVVIIQFFC